MDWKAYPENKPQMFNTDDNLYVSNQLLVARQNVFLNKVSYYVSRLTLDCSDGEQIFYWERGTEGCGLVTHFCEITSPQ